MSYSSDNIWSLEDVSKITIETKTHDIFLFFGLFWAYQIFIK